MADQLPFEPPLDNLRSSVLACISTVRSIFVPTARWLISTDHDGAVKTDRQSPINPVMRGFRYMKDIVLGENRKRIIALETQFASCSDFPMLISTKYEWRDHEHIRNYKLWLAAGAAAGLLSYCLYRYIKYRVDIDPIGNNIFSVYHSFLVRCVKQPIYKSTVLRSQFTTMPEIVPSKLQNHTHPTCAAIRNNAATLVDNFGKLVGLQPYYVQTSSADTRNGRVGCRTLHWAKDTAQKTQLFRPNDNNIMAIMDVDYYLDMPKMLANWVYPYLISTFQPSTAAKCDDEYSFTFLKDNYVKYVVSGGAEYCHQVWNYGADVLLAVAPTFLGLSYRITAYNVDRRQLDPHHQLILLTPISTIISPLFDISRFIGGTRLERLQVVNGEHIRMKISTKKGLITSTANVGKYACATIPSDVDDAIAITAKMGTTNLAMAQVKSYTGSTDVRAASTLVDYHRTQKDDIVPTMFPVDKSIQRYQYGIKDYEPDAKCIMQPFMTPIIPDQCYVPDNTPGNDKRAVEGRILQVKAPKDLPISTFLQKVMDEFVTFLVPDSVMNTLVPVDQDELYERQNRPAQRTILNAGASLTSFSLAQPIQSFIKAESYNDAKDPRIISTIPPKIKYHYSCYMYSFSDAIMKKQPWYAFGKTPKEVAHRVAELALTAMMAINTDFNRFDGRVSHILRMVEQMAALRAFHPDYKQELLELHNKQQNQKAFTKHGYEYFTGLARNSGSSETADFNSMGSAFVAYYAKRKTKAKGAYLLPQEAWDQLGIYGGDDGLTFDVDPKKYAEAATEVGQVLDAVVINRGEDGVSFLSREFSYHVWNGSLDSMCDVPRQLSKLHVTHNMNPKIDAYEKIRAKCLGYIFTDENTPIIGKLSKAVLQILGKQDLREDAKSLQNYFARFDRSDQFPNTNEEGWMDQRVSALMPLFDHKLFDKWILGLNKESILKPPMCQIQQGTNIPPGAVVNGDVSGLTEKDVSKLDCPLQSLKKKCDSKCPYFHVVVRKRPKLSDVRKPKPNGGKVYRPVKK